MNLVEKFEEINKRIDRIEAIQKELLNKLGYRINLFRNPLKNANSYIEKVDKESDKGA